MDRASISLLDSDFVLFDVILKVNDQADIIGVFRARAQTTLFREFSRPESTRRINELKQAQIILLAPDAGKASSASTHAPGVSKFEDQPDVNKSLHKRRLRISNNFMFRPVQTGFEIWSPVSRSFHVLSLDMALVLVYFSSGKTVGEFLKERNVRGSTLARLGAAKWLQDMGLLVRVSKKPSRVVGQAAPADNATITSQATVPSPALPDRKGRVPIYFVPHMANHFPLALGMMYSFIAEYGNGMLQDRFMPVPIMYSNKPEDIFVELYGKYGPGVWLFSSYMWSIAANLKISAAVKEHDRRNITIHGGPSTPSYEAACSAFLSKHESVDIAVHGEGEITIVNLLDSLSSANMEFDRLHEVNGITFRAGSTGANGAAPGTLVRTPPRARMRDLDVLPSPYLSGAFSSYTGPVDAAIVETNRGCPFGCTFCDWGSATNQKIRKFDLERVKSEIEWIGEHQVRVLWVADANFGIYDRDIEIAEWICAVRKKYGYPREVVVNYTKNATKRLAVIVEHFAAAGICSQGVISIQTRDRSTLEVINRKNIKTDKYDDLAEIFRVAGLPLSTDLMIGLPGMTVGSFKEDLQYFFDKDVTVKAYRTELLPNSPMADPDYIEKYKIKVDRNNFLISSFSYTVDDLHLMNIIYQLFTVADGFSTLRYVLRYLSWDCGIAAVDYIHELYNEIESDPYRFPTLTYVSKVFQYYLNVPGGWHQFYEEIAAFTQARFGVRRDSAFDAVLYFNEMVMPDDALAYPLKIQLEHDVPAYFRDNNLKDSENRRKLVNYPPTRTVINNKYSYGHINYNSEQYDSHQVFWELQSPTARIHSVPNFM